MFLFMAEIAIRLFYQFGNLATASSMQYTDGPGWRTTPHIKDTRSFPGYGKIAYSTTRNGFRVFGDPHSKKQKIFFIGDSQTQSRKVSDGDTYFEFVGRQTDSEIFAYGGGGYGSLQEYMILLI